MRPEVLFPLFRPATTLTGVGTRVSALLEKLTGGDRVVDLLWHLPEGLTDRRYAPALKDAIPGRIATLTVKIDGHTPGKSRRQPYKVSCSDATGSLSLAFFHARPDYLTKTLPVGEIRVISGRVEEFGGQLQMAHPDYIVTEDEIDQVQTVTPVYPLTAGLAPKTLAKAASSAVSMAAELPEWQDPAYLKQMNWPTWLDALTAVHRPMAETELDPSTPARARLAYDELLANQLALALTRRTLRRITGRALKGTGSLRKRLIQALPYELTGSQETALREILGDMASDDRMLRLLQGDVGSGKTVVALIAMAAAVESGAQAALMAPTEILARQHYSTIDELARKAGLSTALLTGRETGKSRSDLLERLATGKIDVLVGTHALFSDDVVFHDLALVVIDEQHRFGVHQRLALQAKGGRADMLVMTATPIPRTLMLTAYGDMDTSRLLDKPPGRQPIDTRVLPAERLADVVAALERALSGGAKAYWVCPLVEESEALDATAAEDRYAALKQVFGDKVGLIHGRMTGKEKDEVMQAFAEGDMNLLVATTVIEVGVDVPDATVLVLEHAERFGLAQMHQLRGRIGRGDKPSTCLLIYAGELSETARARLNIMRETEDGFRIAEEDLKLRGAGDLLGTKQSGLPAFKLADLSAHGELLAAARDDAAVLLNRDPELSSERGAAARVLLYLFERDAAIRTLRSG